MHHLNWFRLRYELIRDYPKRQFDIGSVLEAYEFEGKITLDSDKSINPEHYKDHFRSLKWHEHRTIEQLKSIKYAKVVNGSNYYGVGDIVEVVDFWFNNDKYVNGGNKLLFSLSGHHFTAGMIEPATKNEYDEFRGKERNRHN